MSDILDSNKMQDYYGGLVGAKIVGVGFEPDQLGGFTELHVEQGGWPLVLTISCDSEGNGGAYLHVRPVPVEVVGKPAREIEPGDVIAWDYELGDWSHWRRVLEVEQTEDGKVAISAEDLDDSGAGCNHWDPDQAIPVRVEV
jgi:hypothetical protein